jgi:hypothetical protein
MHRRASRCSLVLLTAVTLGVWAIGGWWDANLLATICSTVNRSFAVRDLADPVLPGGELTYRVSKWAYRATANGSFSHSIPANTTFQSVTVVRGSSALSCSTPAVGAMGTVSCNGVGDSFDPVSYYGITTSNKLVTFAPDHVDEPGVILATLPVTGLPSGEQIIDIDLDMVTLQMFGLGSSGQLYTLDLRTGAAAPYGSALSPGTPVAFQFDDNGFVFFATTTHLYHLNPANGAVDATFDLAAAGIHASALGWVHGENSGRLLVLDADADTRWRLQCCSSGFVVAVNIPLGTDISEPVGFDNDAHGLVNRSGYLTTTSGGISSIAGVSMFSSEVPVFSAQVGGGEAVRGIANAMGLVIVDVTVQVSGSFVGSLNNAVTTSNCANVIVTTTVPCPTIAVSPSSLSAGTAGAAISANISASGATGATTFDVTSGSLPAGVSLSSGGTLSGTPTATGTFNFTVTATDPNNCTGARAYSLTINCPTITLSPASMSNGTAGTAYATTVTQSGGVGTTTFAISAGALPTGMSLSSNGEVSGTPTATGPFNFTVRASDANGCTGQRAYSLTVECPTISLSQTTFANGTAGTAYESTTVTQSGGIGTTTFAISAGALPAGMSLSSAGTVSGTPTATGAFNFTVRATDANNCTGTRDYSFTIACPTITLSPGTLPEGRPGVAYERTISQSGGAGTTTFAMTGGSLPPGLTLSSAGVVSGTSTQTGTFNFTVTATDANGCTGSRAHSLTITTFTDGGIEAGVTIIRAAHVIELQTRIDVVRARYGRPAFAWASINAGVTPIRAQDILDLRTAVSEAAVAAGQPPPTFSTPAPAAGGIILGVQITEVRAALLAIE